MIPAPDPYDWGTKEAPMRLSTDTLAMLIREDARDRTHILFMPGLTAKMVFLDPKKGLRISDMQSFKEAVTFMEPNKVPTGFDFEEKDISLVKTVLGKFGINAKYDPNDSRTINTDYGVSMIVEGFAWPTVPPGGNESAIFWNPVFTVFYEKYSASTYENPPDVDYVELGRCHSIQEAICLMVTSCVENETRIAMENQQADEFYGN